MIQEKKGVTFKVILDTRKPPQEKSRYPVKFRVTYRRVPRLIKTKFSMTKDDFAIVTGPDPRDLHRNMLFEFIKMERKAQEIIDHMKVFSFDVFKKQFLGKGPAVNDVFLSYDDFIQELKDKNSYGYSTIISNAQKSFKTFTGKEKLSFEDVTPKFLDKYQRWMLSQGNSLTSIGINVRSLRRIYRKAIKAGVVDQSLYPFGPDPDQYSIPMPQNVKKALTLNDLKAIYEYSPEPQSKEHFYRDMWIFSYLCNGINVKDLCLLRYRNIQNGTIIFRREKTINTSKTGKQVEAVITKEMSTIIDNWGQKPIAMGKFIFPFLDKGDENDAKKIRDKVQLVTRLINKYIRRIADELEISANVTTYTARHSFATHLKRSGVNVSYISEALGHADIKTTESYLASLEIDQKKRIAEMLTDFNQKGQP